MSASPVAIMPYFHLKQSNRHLTSTAGLMLVGQCLLVAQLAHLNLRLPKRGKIKMSDLVKGYLGADAHDGRLVDQPSGTTAAGHRSLRQARSPEQFHSEIKTDFDLERLASGKFDCNDLILRLGMLAYSCLRLTGELGAPPPPSVAARRPCCRKSSTGRRSSSARHGNGCSISARPVKSCRSLPRFGTSCWPRANRHENQKLGQRLLVTALCQSTQTFYPKNRGITPEARLRQHNRFHLAFPV